MRRAAGVLLVLLGLAARAKEPYAAAPSVGDRRGELLRQAMAEGRRNEDMGAWKAAFNSYLTAMQWAPDRAEVWDALWRAARVLNQRGEAARENLKGRYVQRAMDHRAELVQLEKELASRLKEGRALLGRNPLAASHIFNALLREHPEYGPAAGGLKDVQQSLLRRLGRGKFPSLRHYHATVGVYSFNAGDWGRAVENLDIALQSGPLPTDLEAAALPGVAAAARDRLDADLWAVEKRGLLSKAAAFVNDGRPADAEALYRSMLKKDPADKDVRSRLEELRSAEDAREAAEGPGRRKKEFEDRMSAGKAAMGQGRFLDALEEFVFALQLDPADADARDRAAAVRKILKDQGLDMPAPVVEDPAEKKYKEGLRLYGDERVPEARAAFEEALRLNPGHEDAKQALERIRQAAEDASLTQ